VASAITNSQPTRPDAVRPPTLDEVADVLERAIPRVTALLRAVPDGAQRVPHLEWTIAETAAHLWSGVTMYAGLVEGRPHPWTDIDSRAETSAAILAEIQERDPTALAALIERDATPMAAAFRAYGAKPITYLFGTSCVHHDGARGNRNGVSHPWLGHRSGSRCPVADLAHRRDRHYPCSPSSPAHVRRTRGGELPRNL
jgi:Mycothiol maleylpyruvate isomerase N-terminal domain